MSGGTEAKMLNVLHNIIIKSTDAYPSDYTRSVYEDLPYIVPSKILPTVLLDRTGYAGGEGERFT